MTARKRPGRFTTSAVALVSRCIVDSRLRARTLTLSQHKAPTLKRWAYLLPIPSLVTYLVLADRWAGQPTVSLNQFKLCLLCWIVPASCLAPLSSHTRPRGRAALSACLLPCIGLCRLPAHFSLTHRAAGPGRPQCRLVPTVSFCACLRPASQSRAGLRGRPSPSVRMRPLRRFVTVSVAPASGPLSPPSLTA